MHNWRFLLFAFVAVFQPIASFEPGLVDGRQQRCDYRTAFVLREPGVHFHGIYRFTKPLGDHRLNQKENTRDIRRNEVREKSLHTISSPERRLVVTFENHDSSTRLLRSSRAENRLARDAADLRRETRWAQLRTEYRNERKYEAEPERQSSLPSARQTRIDSRYHSNYLAEDENRSPSRRASAFSEPMESQRDTRRNRDIAESQRVQTIRKTRIASNQARNDVIASSQKERRIARETVQMNTRRSEFRAQQARNTDHRVPERRSRNIESRSSSVSSARTYNNEDSRLATQDDTQSLGRDQRRNIQFRRTLDERNGERDSRITYRVIVSADQRIIRESFDRTKNVQNLHAEQKHRTFQDVRRDSRITERKHTTENRRETKNIRDSRSMERNDKSVESTTENRRDSRLDDRKMITENRRVIRNIARVSTTVMQDRAFENKREVRSIERDSRKIGAGARIIENREGSTERRIANCDVERVSRIFTAERDALNQRNTRNVEKNSRTSRLKQATDYRNVDRESRVLGRDRIAQSQKNTPMDFGDVRSADRGRTLDRQRNSRNTGFQTVRVEEMNRRDAQNIEKLSLSVDRIANYGRDTRDNKLDTRTFERQQSFETRDRRNTQRVSRPFPREMSVEGRQDFRNVEGQSQTIKEKRIITNQIDARMLQRDFSSLQRERSAEIRRDIRNIDESSRTFLVENKRERVRVREVRNIEKDSRAFRSEENTLESRITNMARARDSHSTERKNDRVAERQNIRDNRRSRSVSHELTPESRQMSKRSSMELERRESRYRVNREVARKHEFLSMIRKPAQVENETSIINWQYLFYTLQGLYICGVLMQLMNEKNTGKNTRALSLWSTPQHLIKVD